MWFSGRRPAEANVPTRQSVAAGRSRRAVLAMQRHWLKHGVVITGDDLQPAREALERDGHVTVRELIGADEVARFRSLVRRALTNAERLELPPGNDVYQRAFDQYMNLWQVDEDMCAVSMHSGLADVAARLLGVDDVRLYHDQALIKRAGGGHTPWHQDQWYWPLDTDRTITMWLPLHPLDPQMGDLEFVAGSQGGPLGDAPISDAADDHYDKLVAERGLTRQRIGRLNAGDASFHLGWTLHRATPNETTQDREVMTIIWFAEGARVLAPDNPGRQLDLARWLPGCQPGELAASPLNPVVSVTG